MEQNENTITKEIVLNELRLIFESDLKSSTIRWYGKSVDMHPADTLIPALNELLDTLGEKITLIFNDLEYINSSTVVPIMDFIRVLDRRGKYIFLEYDKTKAWQRSMFEALKSLTKLLDNFKINTV